MVPRVAVRTRYADNQTIVFEECADALEKALQYLSQHNEQSALGDDGKLALEPNLRATVNFVSTHLPLIVRLPLARTISDYPVSHP